MKKLMILLLVAGLLLLAGCSSTRNTPPIGSIGETVFTVYKSQQCGCCMGYIGYLDSNGIDFKVNAVPDVSPMKDKYMIPENMRSCHTTVAGKYFIEGHVPLEAINKMMQEKPDIDGIALPGMPSGAAGMPGTKNGKFKIYSIKNGQPELFMEI